MKRNLMLFVMTALLCLLWTNDVVNAQSVYSEEDNKLISSYYENLKEKNWDAFLQVFGEEYQVEMKSYIDDEQYKINSIGVYSVEDIEYFKVISTVEKRLYYPIISELEGEDIFIYLVETSICTSVENEFYLEGKNYNLFFIGTVDGKRKIVAVRLPLNSTIEEKVGLEESISFDCARMGGISPYAATCSYNSLPVNIKVCRWKYGNGSIESVDFKKYVKVVCA